MSTVVGIFADQNSAERAVNEVQKAGVSEDEISIIAREDSMQNDGEQAGQNLEGQRNQGQDLTNGAATGGTLGGLAGLLAGAGALTIPGVGPILAAGPIAAGLTGAAAGGLAGSMVDMGIDQEEGQRYEQEVQQGSILAVVEADQGEEEDIASYFKRSGAQEVKTH